MQSATWPTMSTSVVGRGAIQRDCNHLNNSGRQPWHAHKAKARRPIIRSRMAPAQGFRRTIVFRLWGLGNQNLWGGGALSQPKTFKDESPQEAPPTHREDDARPLHKMSADRREARGQRPSASEGRRARTLSATAPAQLIVADVSRARSERESACGGRRHASGNA